MTRAEAFDKAWRIGAKEKDFSFVDCKFKLSTPSCPHHQLEGSGSKEYAKNIAMYASLIV